MNVRFIPFCFLIWTKISVAQVDSTTVNCDSTGVVPINTEKNFTKLLIDDPRYNQRSPLWQPIARVILVNVFNWTKARSEGAYWSIVNSKIWKKNLELKLAWDGDGIYTNMFSHPYTGGKYFNCARSNGYSFVQSIPFVIGGSLLWEIFAENELPSRNDLIATPIGGAFAGEILYRISSNILNDRKRGIERVARELVAGIIDPTRAINRITTGKMFKVTSVEIYQKEPLHLLINSGVQVINEQKKFVTSKTRAYFNVQVVYGDPFENRKRKPFDFFKIQTELRTDTTKIGLSTIEGFGFLFGKTKKKKNNSTMAALFQYYDHWDYSNTISLSTLGLGPGILSQKKLGKSSISSGFYLAMVAIAQTKPPIFQDTSICKGFKYGGGLKSYVEGMVEINNRLFISIVDHFYHIRSYEDPRRRILYNTIKAGIRMRLFRNSSLGVEHQISYYRCSTTKSFFQRYSRTENRFFFQLDL